MAPLVHGIIIRLSRSIGKVFVSDKVMPGSDLEAWTNTSAELHPKVSFTQQS
jgi:hypothetical protein